SQQGHLLAGVEIDRVDVGAKLGDEYVTVEGEQIDHRPVEDVALGASGPTLLLVLQAAQLTTYRRWQPSAALLTERVEQLAAFGGIPLLGGCLRFGSGKVDEVSSCQHRVTDPADLARYLKHLPASFACPVVGGQPAGHANVALRGPGSSNGPVVGNAVALGEQCGNIPSRRHS